MPYASPPVGELRLVPPRPPQPWTEPLDLTADSEVMCPQLSETVAGDLLGREDCLTINIYAPTSEPGTGLLPVLVYIYGGGFITGSARAEEYGPDRWLDEDILVVTVNYRCEVIVGGGVKLQTKVLEVFTITETAFSWMKAC